MEELFGLKGKVALFTGGSRGLGKAMAIGLAKAGADVAVVGRKPDQNVIDQINACGIRGKFYVFDLGNIEGIPELVRVVRNDFGKIDILVNNAGVQSRLKAVDLRQWQHHRRRWRMDGKMIVSVRYDFILNIQEVNHLISLPSKSRPCSRFKGNRIGFLSLFDR